MSENERAERCETCRFWDTDDGWAGEKLGYCARFPPVFTNKTTINSLGEWPVTFETQWCGEWQPIGPDLRHVGSEVAQ